jgi:hypothetical protein
MGSMILTIHFTPEIFPHPTREFFDTPLNRWESVRFTDIDCLPLN